MPQLTGFCCKVSTSQVLLDNGYYGSVRKQVAAHEDDEGNYDYTQVSNIGMVYLYVHNQAKQRKEKTKADYARVLMMLLEHVAATGKTDIRELTRFDVETIQVLLEQRYAKSSTLAKKIVIMHSFLTWCFEEGYLLKNVARGLRPVKKIKEDIPERDMEEADLKQAIAYFADHPKVQSPLLILWTTGMRLNEVIMPRWGDLYFDRGQRKHRTKRDKVRHVHIKDYALAVLMEYRKRVGLQTDINRADTTPFYPNRVGQRYRLSSLSTFLSEQMAAAGLTTIHGHRVTPHFLRHYFAQTAYANGAPLDWISETVDHASTKITKENYLSRQLKKDRDVSDFVELSD